MRVESVVFNGITFRRYPDSKNLSDARYFRPSSGYYKHDIRYLHREVWKAHNGPIPAGHDVHHKDHNTGNNDISNLEILPEFDHHSMHGKLLEWDPEHLARIRPLTLEWHRSEEGRKWHAQHGIEAYTKRQPRNYKCKQCGADFQSKHY